MVILAGQGSFSARNYPRWLWQGSADPLKSGKNLCDAAANLAATSVREIEREANPEGDLFPRC